MKEITKSENRSPQVKFVWWFFAAIITAIYFFALGTIPLLGPDEARYAQVAREMFERQDWITPTLGGFNWFEKPALLYWLQIVSYKFFGVSEFAARFGSAVCGLLTIFSLWILGRNLAANQPKENNENYELRITNYELANWLALISASSIGLLSFSRGASFDIILTFPLTASLVSFFIFDQSDKKSFFAYYFPLVSFYFFIGVALLAKGLVGIVFPLAIVMFYYLLARKLPGKTFILSLFWGTILSLLIASMWYMPMYRAHGWAFVDEFFIQHHFARFASNKYMHPQPFWFFWLILPLMTLPWLPFFLASIWDSVKVIFQRRDTKKERENTSSSPSLAASSSSSLRVFASVWLLVPLVFFSFSGSKLPGYILPALPAAVILTADFVLRFVRKSRAREVALQILAFATFAAAAFALQFIVTDFARDQTVKQLIAEADARGYSDATVLNMSTIVHNTEFYAAGRLIRLPDGKIRKFDGVEEIAEEIRRQNGKTVLVLVPFEYAYQLGENNWVSAKILGDNDKVVLFAVSSKENKPDVRDRQDRNI